MPRKHKVPPIVWTILCFIVFLFGATPYHKTVDLILMAVRLPLAIGGSIVFVWMSWRHWHHEDNTPFRESWLKRVRNWSLDREDDNAG